MNEDTDPGDCNTQKLYHQQGRVAFNPIHGCGGNYWNIQVTYWEEPINDTLVLRVVKWQDGEWTAQIMTKEEAGV